MGHWIDAISCWKIPFGFHVSMESHCVGSNRPVIPFCNVSAETFSLALLLLFLLVIKFNFHCASAVLFTAQQSERCSKMDFLLFCEMNSVNLLSILSVAISRRRRKSSFLSQYIFCSISLSIIAFAWISHFYSISLRFSFVWVHFFAKSVEIHLRHKKCGHRRIALIDIVREKIF